MSSVLTHLKTRNFPLYPFAAFLFLPGSTQENADFILFKYPQQNNSFLWIKGILLAAPGVSKTLIGEQATDFIFQKNRITLRALFKQVGNIVICLVVEATISELLIQKAITQTASFVSLILSPTELKNLEALDPKHSKLFAYYFESLFYALLPFIRSSLSRSEFSGSSLSSPSLFLPLTLDITAVTYRFSEQLLIDSTEFLNSLYDDLTSIDSILSFERHITYPSGVAFFYSGYLVLSELNDQESKAVLIILASHDMLELEKESRTLKLKLHFGNQTKLFSAVQIGSAILVTLLQNYLDASDEYDAGFEKRMHQALCLMKDKGLFSELARELKENHMITNSNLQQRLYAVSHMQIRKDRSVVLPRRKSIPPEEAKRARANIPTYSKLSHQHYLSSKQLRSTTPRADRNRSIDLGAHPSGRSQLPESLIPMAQKRSASSQKRFEKQLAKFSKVQADRTAHIQRQEYFFDNISKPKVDPKSGLQIYYSGIVGQTKAIILNVQVGKRGHFLIFHKVHFLSSGLLSSALLRNQGIEEALLFDSEAKKGLTKKEISDILYRLDHSKRKPNTLPFLKAHLHACKKLKPFLKMSQSFRTEEKMLRVSVSKAAEEARIVQEEEDLNGIDQKDCKEEQKRWVVLCFEEGGECAGKEESKIRRIEGRLQRSYFYNWD